VNGSTQIQWEQNKVLEAEARTRLAAFMDRLVSHLESNGHSPDMGEAMLPVAIDGYKPPLHIDGVDVREFLTVRMQKKVGITPLISFGTVRCSFR